MLLFVGHLSAATWYAAADGSATNGTTAQPWGVAYAFTNNPYLQAGDMVLFKDGTYYPTNDYFYDTEKNLTNAMGVYVSGITYQAQSLWGFTIMGGLYFPYTPKVTNTTISKMHFNLSKFRAYTNAWEEIFGLSTFGGNNITFSHNLIENCSGGGIGKWSASSNTVIVGNIIRFNGAGDWTGRYTESTNVVFERGSGLYSENEVGTVTFSGNILYYNHTHGVSIKTDLVGFNLTNNVAMGGTMEPISLENNHTPCLGLNVISNFTWCSFDGVQPGLELGYDWWGIGTNHLDSVGNSNIVAIGNTVVGGDRGIRIVNETKQVTVQSNRIVALNTGANVAMLEEKAPTNSPSYTFQGNEYFIPTLAANNFSYWGTNETWAQWQAVSGESGSTLTAGMPNDLKVFSFRPSADTQFVHVVVYNWATNASADVDLTTYFQSGSGLRVYDAQNVPTTCTNLIYAGGSVTLPLTLTNRASIVGPFDDLAAWTGFDPRFRVFVIYKDPTYVAATTSIDRLTIQQLNFR